MQTKTRKTPCQNCKGGIRTGRITEGNYWWCNGCGEWEIVGGKAVRPTK